MLTKLLKKSEETTCVDGNPLNHVKVNSFIMIDPKKGKLFGNKTSFFKKKLSQKADDLNFGVLK